MKTPIYRILLVVGAFLSFSCSDDRSTDKADTQPSVAAKPELVIGDLDTLNRLLSITISNHSKIAIYIPVSYNKKNVCGAYWFVGEEIFEAPHCGTGIWDSVITIETGGEKRIFVRLPDNESDLPPKMTLAIVYGAQVEVSREEIPRVRQIEAEVTIAGTTEAEQESAPNP